jgi:hypothetical protein
MVVLLILRMVFGGRRRGGPALGKRVGARCGTAAGCEQPHPAAVVRPEQVSVEYSPGGAVRLARAAHQQAGFGRDFGAWLRQDAPGVLVVERRQRRWR